ncbi:RNA polymerase subunit sigma-70 [Mesorhizobium sp.]|uniref:RNA polymerase subunit sigma-70 n=1 Tax=Mesorhizobium sp. TaxID=1871066 RepID=UPI000FE48B8B|nr:RNA polymerase subunit sigma-70 [Mesorhizobium sp.]RWM08956.1 MAG: RNA polymerase subunit sigma-70 [Mesorhizobium sp.]
MEKSKRIGGRPPHKPNQARRQIVEFLAGAAISQAEICAVLGIDRKTLRRHYRRELDRVAARVETELVGDLLRIAGGNDGTALKAVIFALRSCFGWSEFAPPRARKMLFKVDDHIYR